MGQCKANHQPKGQVMATNETPATEQGGHTADVANEQPQTRLSVALARQTELLTELAAKDGTIRELREAVRVLAEECDASRRTHLDVTSSPNVRTHRRLTDKNPIATAALRAQADANTKEGAD